VSSKQSLIPTIAGAADGVCSVWQPSPQRKSNIRPMSPAVARMNMKRVKVNQIAFSRVRMKILLVLCHMLEM
jgi:hypothetical protein